MSREEEANNPACRENYADASARLNRNLEELRHRITDQSGQPRRPRPSGLRPPTARAGTGATAHVQMASLTTHPSDSETVQSRAARLHLMSPGPNPQQSTQTVASRVYTKGRPRSPAATQRENIINVLDAEYSAQADNAGNVNVVPNRIQTEQYAAPPGIENRPSQLLNASATQQAGTVAPMRTSRLPTAPGRGSRLPQIRPTPAVCAPTSASKPRTGIPTSRLPTTAGTSGQNVAGPSGTVTPRPTGAIPKTTASRQNMGRKNIPASGASSKASVPGARQSISASRRESRAGVCPSAGRQSMGPSAARKPAAVQTRRPSGTGSKQTLMTSFGPIQGLGQLAFTKPVQRKRYYENIAQAYDEDLDFVGPPEYDDYLDVTPPSPVKRDTPGRSNWQEEEFAMLEQNVQELQQQVSDPHALHSQLNALMDIFENKLLETRNIQRADMAQEGAMPEVCPPPAAATPQREARQSLSPRRRSTSSPAAAASTSPVCPTEPRQSLSPRRRSMSPAAAASTSPVCPTELRQSLSPRRTSTSSPAAAATTSPVCPTEPRQSLSPRRRSTSPAAAASASPVCPTEPRQSLSPRRRSMSPAAAASTSPVCPTEPRQSLSPRRTSTSSPAAAATTSPVCPTEPRQSLSPRRRSTSPAAAASASPVCPTEPRQSLSPRRTSTSSPAAAATTSPVCPTEPRQSLSPRRRSTSPAAASPTSTVCPTEPRQSLSPRRRSMSPAAASPTSTVCPTEPRQSLSPRRRSMSPAAASPTSTVCPTETRQSSPPRRTSMSSSAAASPTSTVCPTEPRQSSPPRQRSMAAPDTCLPDTTGVASRIPSRSRLRPPSRIATAARPQAICPPEARPSTSSQQQPTTTEARKSMGASRKASTASVAQRPSVPTKLKSIRAAQPTEAALRVAASRKSLAASRQESRAKVCPPASRSTAARRSSTVPPAGFGRTNTTARRQPADAAQRAAERRQSLAAIRSASTATVARRQTIGPSAVPPSGFGRTNVTARRQPADAAQRAAERRQSLAPTRSASTATVARRQTIGPSAVPPSGFGRTNVTARRQPADAAQRAAERRQSLAATRSASTATVARRQTIGPSAVPPSGFGRTNVTARRQPADAAQRAAERRQSLAPTRSASTATVARRQTIGPSAVPPSGFGRTNVTARRQPADAAQRAAERRQSMGPSRRESTATVTRRQSMGPPKVPPSGFGRTNTTARRQPIEAPKRAPRSASTATVSRRQTIGASAAPGRQAADARKSLGPSRRESTATVTRRQSMVPPSGFGRTNTTARRQPADKSLGPHRLAKSLKKPTTSIQRRPSRAEGPVCRTEPRSTKDIQRKVDSEILGGLKSRQQKASAQQQKNLSLLRSQVLKGKPGKPDKDDKAKSRRSSRFDPKPGPSGVGKPKLPIRPPSVAAKKINKEIKKKVEESQKGKTPIPIKRPPKPKSEAAAPKGASKAGYDVPKAIPRRPLIKTEGLGGPPIEKAQTDEAYKIMAMEKKGMNLTGDPKDVANFLVPSNEPKLKAVGNALESVNEGIVAANIPTSKINKLNNLVTEEIGITLRSRPQPNPQTGLAAATLEKVSLQLPTTPTCDYLECEVVLSNFTVENYFQPRGTDMPKWFPGLYTILPGEKSVMARSSPSDTLMKAWTELKPDYLKV